MSQPMPSTAKTEPPAPEAGAEGWLGRHRLALLGLVLAVAAWLRLAPLGEAPLWQDEAYSLWFSDQSWDFLWRVVPLFENHPPLYYGLLKAWRELAGSSEFALRFPSAVAGIALVAVMALAGRIAGGPRFGWALGLMAAALAALWRLQIDYSMETRSYIFAALGTGMILVGGLAVLRHPERLRRPMAAFLREEPATALALAGLGAGMALALWANHLGALPAVLAGLYLIGWWLVVQRGDAAVFWKLLAAAALAVLLYAPNYRMVLAVPGRDLSDFWIAAPRLWQLADVTLAAVAQPVLDLDLKAEAAIAAVLLGLGALGFWRLLGRAGPHGPALFGFVVLLVGGHWLGLVAITYLVQPLMLPRTLIFVQPPLLLMLAGLPWAWPQARGLLAAGLLGYVALGAVAPPAPDFPRTPYDAMVRAIAESDSPDAPVIVVPPAQVLVFEYYEARLGVDLDLRPYPTAFPATKNGLPTMEAPPVDAASARAMLDAVAGEPVVWAILRVPGVTDPEGLTYGSLAADGFEQEVVVGDIAILPNLSRFRRDGAALTGAALGRDGAEE